MKKQKRQPSFITKSKQPKTNIDTKTPLTSKKRLPYFKHNEQHKENKSIVPQASFLTKSSKKTCAKQKQRSRSLLSNKKTVEPFALQSHRHTFFDAILKRPDKDQTNVSAHIASIRYDRPLPLAENFYSSFNLSAQQFPNALSEAREDEELKKIRQLQEENKSFEVNIAALKSEMSHFIRENQCIKEQNIGLRHQITSFQVELQGRAGEYKAKEAQLRFNHKRQQKDYESNIDKLQSNISILTQQKSQGQGIIKAQQQDIAHLRKDNVKLKKQCQQEHQQNQVLKREKEEAVLRIISLQQELDNFSQSLSHFDDLKKTYQCRLTQLQTEKQRIKKNAFELLEMVQKCRQA